MVIMIDDDDDALEIYHMLIERSSLAAHFHTFNNGHKALDFLGDCTKEQETFPRYILLDLNMPDIDGIEFVQAYEAEYIEKYPQSKIIILTSSVREQDNELAVSHPSVSQLISKPLSKDALLSMLEQSIEN